MHATITKSDEFHVENLDGFETLRDRIEDQANSVQWQIDDYVTAQWVLMKDGIERNQYDATLVTNS